MPAVSVVRIPHSKQIVPLITGHDRLDPLHVVGVAGQAGRDLVHLLGVEAGDARLDHLEERTVCQLSLPGLRLLYARGEILLVPLVRVINLILIALRLLILVINILNNLLCVIIFIARVPKQLPSAPLSPWNIVGCPPLSNVEFVFMFDLILKCTVS